MLHLRDREDLPGDDVGAAVVEADQLRDGVRRAQDEPGVHDQEVEDIDPEGPQLVVRESGQAGPLQPPGARGEGPEGVVHVPLRRRVSGGPVKLQRAAQELCRVLQQARFDDPAAAAAGHVAVVQDHALGGQPAAARREVGQEVARHAALAVALRRQPPADLGHPGGCAVLGAEEPEDADGAEPQEEGPGAGEAGRRARVPDLGNSSNKGMFF